MKTFNPLSVSSKFAICGLPVRVDTYKTCAFACKYCFSNNRKICEFEKNIQIADVKSVQRKLQRIFEQRKVDSSNFLDTLISSGIDWHMGGMSDPLQPIEKEIGATKSLLDVTNQYGNLLPEIRLEAYTPFIEKLNKLNIPYSIADNDLHYLGTNKCCCGDALIRRSTDFNNTAMIKTFGLDYTKADIDRTLATCGVCNCKCNQYFTSNRQEGCITVKDFYDKRFDRKSSPFSPKFQYRDEDLIGA